MKHNEFTGNYYGIWLAGARGNFIYRNNLIDNLGEVAYTGENTWDNGCEGNFWIDYNGSDVDGDGVGDTYLPWKDVDYFPLMEPWSYIRTFHVEVNETVHAVDTFCNSTVASFAFNQSLNQLSFNVTGPSGFSGFCNVTIPKTLLDGHFVVLIDDVLVFCSLFENTTHNFIQLTYAHSTHRIRILIPVLGDLNFDGAVNIYDVVLAVAAYDATPESPCWNPYADVAPPWEMIDIFDVVTIVFHYGRS